ncbi:MULTISPECIES: DUF2254 domain-containing protein [Legionella]|uniref:DUF2254 domain-containing protein n=1 Tax=Legionella drozanskii LLAP-1 TaxID=1212489 RepID=A0A0W0SVE4_9GAMM|nr:MULTISPECIES: DUF2254 domain-containing protein [Legionella]KTC87330.1 hypothetical protein Ldro_0949 [Legionella drozanskii LLAP-1]PJE08618.1 MAG: DUF2254 domain-containing protein [Legionella sp.]
MHSRLLNFFSELRASYWYIPLLMAIGALLLSILTLRLDHLFIWHWLQTIGWFHAANPEGARAILSTIASSMITVAGVTFSMTIVAVAFAASQVGPRLTSNFMRDRANQITLGTFIATFLYCLFILLALFNANKNVITQTEGVFIPQISLLVALLLAISSIIVLIYFFHHIPESINMSNVIARIADELNDQLECLFPTQVGNELSKKPSIPKVYSQKTSVNATNRGYLRIIDGESLIESAKKCDVIVALEVKYGDFLTENSVLFTMYSKKELDASVYKQFINAFVLGYNRNQERDTLFLIDELIEIIARALSPGINDPFTAMTCLDWLQSSLQQFSKINPPSAYRYDVDNKLRLIAEPISFAQLCDLIFSRVQPYVCKDRNAAVHMMIMIISIHTTCKEEQYKMLLAAHATSLNNAAQECLLSEDYIAFQSVYKRYFT